MKISLNWVNELVDVKTIDLKSLIEKLTLGGFEVEKILKLNNQIILDISATAISLTNKRIRLIIINLFFQKFLYLKISLFNIIAKLNLV